MIFNEKGLNDSIVDFFTKTKESPVQVDKVLSFDEAKSQLEAFNQTVTNGGVTLEQYFERYAKGNKILHDYVTTTDTQSQSIQGLMRFSEENRNAQIAHNQAIEQGTIKAKASAFAMKGLAAAGNMLSSALLSIGISFLIQGLAEFVDAAITTKKEIKELGEEASDAIKELSDSMKETEKSSKTLIKSYEKLAKGVNETGQNIALSDEEYEQFLETNRAILDLFPSLNRVYDKNGNAMIKLDSSTGTLAETLEHLIEVQRQVTLNEMAEKLPEVFNAAVVKVEEFNEQLRDVHNQQDLISMSNFKYDDSINSWVFESEASYLKLMEYQEALNKAGVNYRDNSRQLENGNFLINFKFDPQDLNVETPSGLTVAEIFGAKISEELNTNSDKLEIDKSGIESQIKDTWASLNESLYAYLETESATYRGMSDQMKQAVQTALFNVNWSDLNLENGWEDAERYIDEQIMNWFTGPKTAPLMRNLFSVDKSEVPAQEYLNIVQDLIDTIVATYGTDESVVRAILGLNGDEEAIVQEAKNKYSGHVQGKVGDWLNNLTVEELKIVNSDEFEQAIENRKVALGDVGLQAQDYANALEDIRIKEQELATSSPSTISTSVEQMSAQLESQFSQIGDLYTEIFSENGFNSNVIDNAMLHELKETLSNVEGVSFDSSELEKFFNVLADGEFTANEAQQAFNDLATAWFYSTETLSHLNEETATSIEQQLEQMGVVNAHEVVQDALNKQEAEAFVIKKDLTNATVAAYTALFNEAEQAGAAKQKVYELALAEIAYGNNELDFSQKIEQIYKVAKAYGDAATAARAAAIMSDPNYDPYRHEGADPIGDIVSSVEVVPELVLDPKTTEAAKAGAAGGDAYVDAFEKELGRLQDLRDQGKISEKQYLEEYRKLYERYFKDIEKYAEEFAKHQHEYLSGYRSMMESLFSGIVNIIDRQIDKLEEQRDATIESYEKQKEEASEYYESQIEEIDKQIDKINEAKEARKAEMDIQKSLYDLIRSNNQRTEKGLDEFGNTVYRTNPTDIRDKRNDYQDAKDEKTIQKLEKQREEYERLQTESDEYWQKMIDQTNEYYDNLIQGLENYKTRWQELAEMEEQAKILALLEEFGYTEEDILNMSESAFQDLKKQYLQVLKDMNAGNGGVLKHLSDISGVDMTQLEGHLQATADTTAVFGEELKTVVEELDRVCKGIEDVNKTFSDTSGIKTYGEILTEFILKAQEAAKKAAELKETQESIYNNGEAPFQGTYDTTGKSDSNKSSSTKSASVNNVNGARVVLPSGLTVVPVDKPLFSLSSLDYNIGRSANTVNQIASTIADKMTKSISKTNTNQTIQLTQKVTIDAPYLTNESGYNRLMNEFKGLSSVAYIDSITARK